VDAQSCATAVCISQDVCHDSHPLCSSSDQVIDHLHSKAPEVNLDTDLRVTGCCGTADSVNQSDKITDVALKDDGSDSVKTDVQDLSSFETTLEYSICSDIQDSKMSDKCEMQTTIEYYAKSATESVINAGENPVVDVRIDGPVTNDIQKSVDLLTLPNSMSVDLRNSPKVCSPPTLMVV